MPERLIFHVDVNSAFLSWEAVRRVKEGLPDLRKVPSIIGGDPARRTSVVLAKSMPAKKFGIVTGEPVAMAVRKCPELVIAPSDFKLYRMCSKAFKDICRAYAPEVEEYSIDECFLDMSGTELIYPDPIATAYEIKDKIRDELGFTVNIGIGPNKMLAKTAGDFEKPDKVHTLFAHELRTKYWPLNCSNILYCGKATVDKLYHHQIRTIGELAQTDPRLIKRIVGEKIGQQLWEFANGIDDSPIVSVPEEPKGYSNEVTFEEDVTSYDQANQILLFLADNVAARVRKDTVKARCISVTIRGNDMKKRSHQRSLYSSTDITTEVYDTAKILFEELWDGSMPIRLIGLSMTDLDRDGFEQISFMESERHDKEHKVDEAVDAIRVKFGKDMIKRGSMMGKNIRIGH